ncbi:MAG: hypothetical protein K0R57_1995 [Paenibacillaceae bacterium]|jgi:hypothetical protein|nr:hypothetical protein [Paenibacillaceae bacterium]
MYLTLYSLEKSMLERQANLEKEARRQWFRHNDNDKKPASPAGCPTEAIHASDA